jgi:hypothetical protein
MHCPYNMAGPGHGEAAGNYLLLFAVIMHRMKTSHYNKFLFFPAVSRYLKFPLLVSVIITALESCRNRANVRTSHRRTRTRAFLVSN